MRKTYLSLVGSIFAAVMLCLLSLPAFSAIPPPEEQQAQSETLRAIHDVIAGMNRADLGIVFGNPTFARHQPEYTRERAEGMRLYSEGKYDEALLHLDRAYSILRNSPDWTQLQ